MFFGSAMVDHTSEKLKHVAFSVIIAVAVLTALGSVIISSVSTEGFEINEATLKKGSGYRRSAFGQRQKSWKLSDRGYQCNN